MTAEYYLLGNDEAVLGRVLNSQYAYLNPYAEWIQHPEVCDLIMLGCVWELPAELPFAFPGWAREITAAEAEQFMADFAPSQRIKKVEEEWRPIEEVDMFEIGREAFRREFAAIKKAKRLGLPSPTPLIMPF